MHFWRRQTSAPDPQARGEVRVIASEENEEEEEGTIVAKRLGFARELLGSRL